MIASPPADGDLGAKQIATGHPYQRNELCVACKEGSGPELRRRAARVRGPNRHKSGDQRGIVGDRLVERSLRLIHTTPCMKFKNMGPAKVHERRTAACRFRLCRSFASAGDTSSPCRSGRSGTSSRMPAAPLPCSWHETTPQHSNSVREGLRDLCGHGDDVEFGVNALWVGPPRGSGSRTSEPGCS
jgi:hypothetical protein